MEIAFWSYFYPEYWRNKMTRLIVCGAINWDISCFVEHLPRPGEEVQVKHITRVSGGTGGNVAVAAARILGAGEVALIGSLGEDDIAQQQVAALAAEGIITEGISQVPGEESGQAHILVDQGGQNIIASHLGANARLQPQHLNKPSVKCLLQECQGIALTDPPLDVAEELINLAKQRGIPLFWDPGILVSLGWEALQSLAKQADILFFNEAEAATLFGTAKIDMGIQHLQELGFSNHTVLKLGAQGAALLEPATGVIIEIPALPLKDLGFDVINTVGCGDAFAGVFAAYRVLGASWQKSLVMAVAAAGLNATRLQTRGSPDRVSLEAIEQHSHNFGFVVGIRIV
jgi:ribokinase